MNLRISPNLRRKVLDISKWQAKFDAATAKAQGIEEVVCRASYGSAKDVKVSQYGAAALKAGLVLSMYSFCTAHYASVNGGNGHTAITVAKSQAATFVAIAKSIGANGFLALDVEGEAGQKLGLNKQQLTDMCNAYMDVLASAGYTPVLYMSVDPMITWLHIDQIRYPLWGAYYYRYGTKLNYANDPNKGAFPTTGYGNWMRAHAARMALWQYTSEGYAAMYGCGNSDAAGLDKNWGYYDYTGGVTPPQKEGIQTMKIVDVYASITQAQTGTAKRFNVQGFESPDVNSKVLTDNAAGGLPDGRYWCNATGVKLAGLDGYNGAEIQVGDEKMYVAIVPGATEITEMSNADAYKRFVESAKAPGFSAAEMLEVKNLLAATENKLADAEAKIAKAQQALA